MPKKPSQTCDGCHDGRPKCQSGLVGNHHVWCESGELCAERKREEILQWEMGVKNFTYGLWKEGCEDGWQMNISHAPESCEGKECSDNYASVLKCGRDGRCCSEKP